MPVADLAEMLRSLRPELAPGEFAFCALPPGMAAPPSAIGWFRESEGDTVILPFADAEALGLAPGFRAAHITLTVHSALSAVGLTPRWPGRSPARASVATSWPRTATTTCSSRPAARPRRWTC